jgi:hypothetical protein
LISGVLPIASMTSLLMVMREPVGVSLRGFQRP